MRPLKGTLSAPSLSCARVSAPTVTVRVQRGACRRLSLGVGAAQRPALRRPGAGRVKTIRPLAASLSVKPKLVPNGGLWRALADTAVGCLATRKRLCVRWAPVSRGAVGVGTPGAAFPPLPAIVTLALALVALPRTSVLVTVTVYVPAFA